MAALEVNDKLSVKATIITKAMNDAALFFSFLFLAITKIIAQPITNIPINVNNNVPIPPVLGSVSPL